MKRILIVLVVALLSFSCGGSPSHSENSGKLVTKVQYEKKWAFTVEKGYVYSVGESAIFKSNGVEYQLNGAARMQGYKSIDAIWSSNSEIPGTKVSLSPFIDLALKTSK